MESGIGQTSTVVVPMKRPLSDASHSALVNSSNNTSSGMTGSDSSASMESPPKPLVTQQQQPLSVIFNRVFPLKLHTARCCTHKN